MNRQLTISYRLQDHDQMVHFGVPENQQEVQHMYQLRYQVYVEKKHYIPAHLCPDGLDIDHIDRKGGCYYFVAQCDEHLVGAMRLIRQDPLPIRQYYWRFEEPVDMRGLQPHQKVQIGRLVSYRPPGIIIPPSLVPLGLIHCATHFCLAHDIRSAYATLKVELIRQMERWGLPVRRIDTYECIYDQDGHDPLKGYYNDPNDPACPAYFRPGEVESFYEHLLQQGLVFQQVTARHYLYRPANPT